MIGDKWGLPYRLIHRNKFNGMYEHGQITTRHPFDNRKYLSLETLDGQVLKVGGTISIRGRIGNHRFEHIYTIDSIYEYIDGEKIVVEGVIIVHKGYKEVAERKRFCILKEDIACLKKIK